MGSLDESVALVGAFSRHCAESAAGASAEIGERLIGTDPDCSSLAGACRAARVDLVRGRPDAALQRLRLHVETGLVRSREYHGALLLCAEAELLLGRPERIPEPVMHVRRTVEASGDTVVLARACWLLGRAAREAGDMAVAVPELTRAAELDPVWYLADAVTLVAELGRDAVARDLLELATDLPLPPLLQARRTRALTAAGADSSGLVAALQLAAEHQLGVEEIELLLAAAVRARRETDEPAARAALGQARERVQALGLAGFDRAFGVSVQPQAGHAHAASVRHRLSKAELRVADVVAQGLTNRQTAETLFLSVKTVDFHLQQIYRKLGVRTRTELAVLVTRDVEHAGGGAS